VEDFDYLAPDSNAAWLDGNGDGRFERYERFYREERSRQAAGFDLEKTNEEYGEWASGQPGRLLSVMSAPWFGQVLVAFFSVYMGSRLVPALANRLPVATGGLLVITFIGLRVFHWRRRKRK
jgi:hypothetical protein